MAALPVTVNLTAYRGDSWSQMFRFLRDNSGVLEPVDLTTATLAAQARGTDPAPTIDLTVTTVGDPTGGTLQLAFPPGNPPEPDIYDYDIELVDNGVVTTWVCGRLQLRRDVTHEAA